jgi:hypothetical protein
MEEPMTPNHIIWIETETLTDGSEVFNVIVDLGKLPAVDESSARDMAEAIMDAVNVNTNELVDIMEASA